MRAGPKTQQARQGGLHVEIAKTSVAASCIAKEQVILPVSASKLSRGLAFNSQELIKSAPELVIVFNIGDLKVRLSLEREC